MDYQRAYEELLGALRRERELPLSHFTSRERETLRSTDDEWLLCERSD